MRKILITGACGFVAQHLIRHILQQENDSEILGVDVAPVCASESMGIRYRQLDLTGRTELAALLEKFAPDWIIHLAAVSSVSDSWQRPEECFLNNTGIFLNLVEALRLLGLKSRLLSVGSSEEYGPYPTEKMPLREEYELHPGNPYAVARVAQEQLSRLYAQNYGLDIVMTRSFNHIGPGQRDTFVVPSFVRQLVELSRHNAELAGVEDCVRFEVADAGKFHRESEYGQVVTNPPYGERLLEKREAEGLYRAFGKAARQLPEKWRLVILSSHTEFERAFGRPAEKKRKLYNGMIKCDAFFYHGGAKGE